MSQNSLIEKVEKEEKGKEHPLFRVGDTVDVHMRIIEGDKERIQVYSGTVIGRKGSGISETFTVYRIAYGSSMEKLFLLHSPKIAKIVVKKRGKVRRAKLYYIRGKSGKKARVQELLKAKSTSAPKETVKEAPSEEKPVEEGQDNL